MTELLDCWSDGYHFHCKFGMIGSAPRRLGGRDAWCGTNPPRILDPFHPIMFAFNSVSEMWSWEVLPRIAITSARESGDGYNYIRFSDYLIDQSLDGMTIPGRDVTYRLYPSRWVDYENKPEPFLIGRLAD